MSPPRIALATLCLNEAEWLERLYEQHKDWPGLVAWSFVEYADPMYYKTNMNRVSKNGLSMDATTDMIRAMRRMDDRIRYDAPRMNYVDSEPAQGKCFARTLGLRALDDARPDFVFVLDADEFYTRDDQRRIAETMAAAGAEFTGFAFGLRTIWRPPSIADRPLMALEAKGCLFSVPICRGWRWAEGIEYRANHNTPEVRGTSLGGWRMAKFWGPTDPACVHMGFTASLESRQAKHKYYEARGEGKTDHRAPYVACRRAFETWRPGGALPGGARVVPYAGPVPEVFR